MNDKNVQNGIKLIRKNEKIQFLIVNSCCFLTILLIIIYGKLFLGPFLEPIMSDDKAYIKMAENILEPVDAPYTYRILTPLIVYLLPFDTVLGFIIVNLFSLYATSILFYYYLRKLEFGFGVSLVGVFLFLLNPIVLALIFAICMVDLLTYFFFLLAFYAILSKNNVLLVVSITIGIANREVMLFALILYFIIKFKEEKLVSAFKSTILISILPIFVFFLIRLLYGFNTNYYSIETITKVISIHLLNLQLNIFIHPYLFYLPFGVLWLICLINLKKIENSFLKNSLYLIPFILLQILLATNYSRLLFIAFPIIIPISLSIFKKTLSRSTILILLILAIILSFVHFFGVLLYVQFNAWASLMSPESYFYWALYVVFFDIFIVVILIFLLIKDLFINGEKNGIRKT